ncbi:putative Ser/Thr protein kinase [Bacillus pakistanensis]|uniref:Ser/Thr protein kinase n=1 Tax=Rossellomorea pakistanensis TaxID=992288 RepID=A0ABS2NEU3_9BACI|nr:protein kinase family protein [Bacillus pakistanensis]MBM7586359.1 putative Ser/Thr protein kinase [Bacillus pakistanensis]
MKSYKELATSVQFIVKKSGVVLVSKDDALETVGLGRSAYVFKIGSTNKVLKVFFPQFIETAKEEAQIYEQLQGNKYFPMLFEAGVGYLVIEYVEGTTLFDCLRKGIYISEDIIIEIDHALDTARLKGLNPSDIHLRNILLTKKGTIKMIDVARYRQNKDCTQWDDLKRVYRDYYLKSFFPKKIPAFIMNTIAFFYKKKWTPEWRK